MWTPRRILLLLLGLAGSLSAYLLYAAALGGVDGLPDLPTRLLVPAPPDQTFDFDQPISPTYLRLQEAFGPNSQEVLDTVAYKTRLEKRDQGLVFACGQMEFERPVSSPFVSISPFSVAFFGKEKPNHLKQPGEVREISTFHADRAVLQFDRPVGSPQDFAGGKNPAKLIGMELVSVPDMPSHDVRRGQIWITNNQKSADSGQFLVFRTPGPLSYRNRDGASPDVPQVETAAAVEVVDKKNLPRPLRSVSTATAPVRGDEFRARNAVADILLGVTLPPPTMTAEGMKIYLDRQDDKTPDDKRNSTGYSSVRMIELTEKVQVNLWSDGGGGFPGSPPQEGARPAAVDPPTGFAAVAGGVAADGAAVARRFEDKTLLVIQTLGPFRYDFAASRARFEAAAVTPEAVPNHVTVARHSARGTQDNLFCKVLEIDFLGGAEAKSAAPPKSAAAKPSSGQGMRIKSLTATGPYVFVSVEAEQLQAQGTQLHYAVDAKTRRSDTTLRGNPVIAVRDRTRLEGGSAGTPSEIFISTLSPAPGSKDRKQTKLEVRGPGTIKMFDAATNDTTLTASWGKSLVHEKEKVGDVEQDLLKFEGGGTFEDRKGEMTLSGDQLWLWLAPGDGKSGPTPVAAAAPGGDLSKSLPQRLRAVGRVRSQSPELVIHNTDLLNVWFRDVPPPPPEPPPAPVAKVDPKPAGAPTAEPPLAGTTPAKKPEPEKAKPPVHLSARVIESWVGRYPQTVPAAKPDPAKPKAEPTTLRYELEKARCEDRVVVHQDPEDPLKNPRGLDITGSRLNLDATRAGSVMTVSGIAPTQAEVHFESISLFGPTVVIDQPTNAVSVDGVGKLVMPAQSDLTGAASSRPTEMEVNWTRSMRFFGAKARVEFFGQVQSVQRQAQRSGGKPETAPVPRARVTGYRPDPAVAVRPGPPPDDGSRPESWVLCHRLDVTFDRPVYFNNARRQGPKPAPGEVAADESPRLKTAQCTPMPNDEAAKLPPRNAELARRVFYIESLTRNGKIIKAQRINAEQIDLTNNAKDREQQVIAAGPGDVRILQPGAKEVLGQPARPTTPGQQPPPGEQEMKLTLVKFHSRMVATDKGKIFQNAEFPDGGQVWQVPSDNLNLDVVAHSPPERAIFLECNQLLTVSSSKVRPDAPAEQRLTAVGNAMFRDEKYQGNAHTIQDDGRVTTLTGSDKRMAQLYQLRRTVNEQPHYSGRQFKYYRDGRIEGAESGPGSLRTGPRSQVTSRCRAWP